MKSAITILLILIPIVSFSQQDTLFKVKISTNIIEPVISFNSEEFTPFDEDGYELPPGEYLIKIKHDEVEERWVGMSSELKVSIQSDTLLEMNSLIRYSFITDPFNATVFHNDSLLGLTPLRYVSDKFLEGNFSISKNGYYTVKDNFSEGKFSYRYNLESITGRQPDKVIINRGIGFETPRKWFLISGIGAATLTSAYASFNFKNKANEFYDEYIRTRDDSKLNESNKFDSYFIISVIAMQAAVGALIYFLFFD